MKKNVYVFRYDNHSVNNTDEDYYRLHKFCSDLEISIKYVGKKVGQRCHYLEIETESPMTANFIINNMKYLELYKKPI
jgi:hypothetical protein